MRIYPFRALRYNTAEVSLEDVVTQPYDKISPAMQDAYYEKSPYNLIRVILGKRFPTDTETENVYSRAASTLQEWRDAAVLIEEREPALYGYAQQYTVPGTSEVRERRGLICLGHLYDYAEQVVYRHEQTLSKPKSDRLSLFKSTRTYCEQIYMLYSDPAFTVEKLVFGNSSGTPTVSPDQTVTDEYGVVHSVWKVTDPQTLNLLVGALSDKKLIIADGHHRYETSTAYARERAGEMGFEDSTRSAKSAETASPSNEADMHAGSNLPTPPFPEAAMMMTLVNTDAPGITILPTHRIVYGLKNFSPAAFRTRAEEFFTIGRVEAEAVSGTSDAENVEAAAGRTAPLTETSGVAFLAVMEDGTWLMQAKPDAIAAALQHVPPRQRVMDVVQLHALVLEHLLELTPESIRQQENLRYLRSADDAAAQVSRGEANIAFLIKPVTLDQMKEVSLGGEVMPQKSTDFYPKLLSGLAFLRTRLKACKKREIDANMIEKRLKTRSENGTVALAQNIMELMLPAPRLVVLSGEMGAGKTTLVKGIAQSLGADPADVTSPTFTLVHEYRGTRLKLYHLDLYRLEREEDLLALGLEEMEADPGALMLVEWGEKFPSLMGRARGQVFIQQGDEPDERLFFVKML